MPAPKTVSETIISEITKQLGIHLTLVERALTDNEMTEAASITFKVKFVPGGDDKGPALEITSSCTNSAMKASKLVRMFDGQLELEGF